MPAALPLIAAIVGIAGTGVGLGETFANQPSGPPKPPTPTPAETEATAGKNKQNQIASLEQAFPQIQTLTGGSLSPEAVTRLAELLTGQGGTPGIGASEEDILKLLTGNSNPLPFLVTAGNNPSAPTSTTGLAPGGGA